jgi:hypothetical protein
MLTKREAEDFERLYLDWSSSDYQFELSLKAPPSLTEHQFISRLLAWRTDIIAAIKATATDK